MNKMLRLMILSGACAVLSVVAADAPNVGTKKEAVEPVSQFKPGDRVKAKFGREWRPATVTKVLPNGWITVSMQMNNTTMTPTLMPDKVIALDAPEPREPGKEYIDTPDMREWTMADGTKLPRARVHNWNPKMKKVLLQKENGTCFHAEVIKLSKADQDFLSKLAPIHAD